MSMAKVEVRRVGSWSDIQAGHASSTLSDRSQFDRNARPPGGDSIRMQVQLYNCRWSGGRNSYFVVDAV